MCKCILCALARQTIGATRPEASARSLTLKLTHMLPALVLAEAGTAPGVVGDSRPQPQPAGSEHYRQPSV
jgi:hypothetical protein